MASNGRNGITASESMTKGQVAPLSFGQRFLDPLDIVRTVRKEEWMIGAYAIVYQHYQHISIFCPHLKIMRTSD